jgi:hypothetical protein
MKKSSWLKCALVVVALSGSSACTYTYSCVAKCDGAAFSVYTGGNFSESSAQNAADACVVDLAAAGCVAPRVPTCACVQN